MRKQFLKVIEQVESKPETKARFVDSQLKAILFPLLPPSICQESKESSKRRLSWKIGKTGGIMKNVAWGEKSELKKKGVISNS